MPPRAWHVCTQPGCDQLIKTGQRCAKHVVKRPTSTERGRGAEWRKIRDAFLQKHPWCADPFHVHLVEIKATDVDHIKAGGSDDDDNLQSLCHTCHSRKTAKFDGGFGNQKSSEGRGGNNVSNF